MRVHVGTSSEREKSPPPEPSRAQGAVGLTARASDGALPGAIPPHWNASWGEGIAIAAHDLKTPLTLINGYIALLTAGKLGPLTPRQEAVLREIADNAPTILFSQTYQQKRRTGVVHKKGTITSSFSKSPHCTTSDRCGRFSCVRAILHYAVTSPTSAC
jgi:hypothetical protein